MSFAVTLPAANNAVYKLLHGPSVTPLTTSAASGSKYFFVVNTVNQSGPNPGATNSGIHVLNLVAANLAVPGLTTKLYLEAVVSTTTNAPAQTITTGLYPLTIAAGTWALGTVVSGSTAATSATPAANTVIPVTSGDFTLPADGAYAFGVIVSGTPAGVFEVQAKLMYRNI